MAVPQSHWHSGCGMAGIELKRLRDGEPKAETYEPPASSPVSKRALAASRPAQPSAALKSDELCSYCRAPLDWHQFRSPTTCVVVSPSLGKVVTRGD